MIKKKLVKFFTKTLVGRITDKVVLGGVIQSTNTETRTDSGKLDGKEIVLELLTSSIPVILLLSLIFGWLDIEQVREVAKILLP
jgi:hypothetical protein